jgi:hypothetical protein
MEEKGKVLLLIPLLLLNAPVLLKCEYIGVWGERL